MTFQNLMQVAFQKFAKLREICLFFAVTPCKDVSCPSAELFYWRKCFVIL